MKNPLKQGYKFKCLQGPSVCHSGKEKTFGARKACSDAGESKLT